MRWKEEAVERLESYSAMERAVQTIPQELKRLEMEATTLRGSAMGGTGCRMGRGGQEDLLLDNMVKRQELERTLEQARLFIRITDQALAVLLPEEKQLMEQLYICPKWGNVNQLTVDLGMARATVYRKRDEALRKFALALYGKAE